VALVRQYATRFIALKEGKILFEGHPQEINDDLLKQIYGSFTKEDHEEALP
jgi:phosphonate transport system ATP-binding protein